jgi:hypothetical protein
MDICPFALEPKNRKPDFSDIPDPEYDWTYTIYGKVKKLLLNDAPEPLAKYVTLSNLVHNITSESSYRYPPFCQ